jgi:hypothetical protein
MTESTESASTIKTQPQIITSAHDVSQILKTPVVQDSSRIQSSAISNKTTAGKNANLNYVSYYSTSSQYSPVRIGASFEHEGQLEDILKEIKVVNDESAQIASEIQRRLTRIGYIQILYFPIGLAMLIVQLLLLSKIQSSARSGEDIIPTPNGQICRDQVDFTVNLDATHSKQTSGSPFDYFYHFFFIVLLVFFLSGAATPRHQLVWRTAQEEDGILLLENQPEHVDTEKDSLSKSWDTLGVETGNEPS